MLTRFAYSATRACATSLARGSSRASSAAFNHLQWNNQPQKRMMGTLDESIEASEAYKKSCYLQIDFTIDEDSFVYEAVQKFSAYNVGCLVTVDGDGEYL